jgi:phosphopantothenoylcysteine decarboxylase
MWQKRGDLVCHIELRKWADGMLIAPLSANTMAKISNGICDNLVTLVCRCWNMNRLKMMRENKILNKNLDWANIKLSNPLVVCPAMNSLMWDHPITIEQLDKLSGWGFTIVEPVEKVLMCG